ncbi:serine carboxypeptidase II-3-like [Musa troglodytarum]|uniref:Carboxypeptidase n=1 Tax=Musa troglodytarum TaxID=320322 RepID=A0A9E7FA62_9LILI|nr:serine carboxypeptidase II-3-like [Musa troglodytarum]
MMDSAFCTCFFFFFFSFYIFTLAANANQADVLLRMMRSKWSPAAQQDGLFRLSNSSKEFPAVYVAPQHGLKDLDKIDRLPGQPEGRSINQYAGYVTVDHHNGRALFYYFVESPEDQAKKPLVLWLNGGPGCSSLGYGAMEELGPFRVNSDGKTLRENDHSWINVANIIFLESPAGVGFSYSNTTSDYRNNGDRRTAADSYTFLVNWLERFQEYKSHDFFITGESYGGHYVPQLASLILRNNMKMNKSVINLKGIAIGNAYIDRNINEIEMYEFLWAHAMFSDDTHKLIQKQCNGSDTFALECQVAMFQARREIGEINLYNVYAPRCSAWAPKNEEYDPCDDDYVRSYLNDEKVQNALHAAPTGWRHCSPMVWADTAVSMLAMIKKLSTRGLRVCGDFDAVVPVTSTKASLNMLDLPIRGAWLPWYIDHEVGGHVVEYKGITFVTVRGAGHEVPSYQPERSLAMITGFLRGTSLSLKKGKRMF